MGLFLVPSVFQVLLDPIGPRPVGLVVAVASILPLAYRRRWPITSAFLGTAAWLIPTDGYLILGFVVAVVLFFSVGANAPSLAATATVTLWGAAVGTRSVLSSAQPPETTYAMLVAVVSPVVAGRILAEHQRQASRLAELAASLEQERSVAERVAVAEERARIARELHDAVGHEVTVIALQAEAAAAALVRDPEQAEAPIEVIRTTAGRALNEMRGVVDRLHPPMDEGDPRPLHRGHDLPDLVEQARSVGDRVDLLVEGVPAAEPASLGLAVFRIVQESLTNARKHSPGAPVLVEVDWDGVDVRVSHPHAPSGRAASLGLGLRGMAERARIAGGTFGAGPDGHGRFVVKAHLPTGRRP